jgi:hypothetical protein
MHTRHLSNHAAWAMATVVATAALYGDEALMAECLDGPDSFCDRVAHEFFDDGMSYEQSAWMYHRFSLAPLLVSGIGAAGAGASPDPLRIKVTNDKSLTFLGGRTGDFTMPFYPVDEKAFPRPAEKSLVSALTAQFQLLRPDATCPSIGDYGGPTPLVADSFVAELAWDLFGRRNAARLLSMGARRAEGLDVFTPYFLTLVYGRALPAQSRFASRSVIYPQSGYAVLKSIEGGRFWESPAVHAVLKFGPYGNGHGHADKLHLDISGAGRKDCVEELQREAVPWRYWNSTVSHNTVVVGGRSQPGNEAMFALNNSCGRLLHRHFERDFKIACAEAPDVYEGLDTYRRTIVMPGDYLIDLFEVEARKSTTFDWFLHGRGRLSVKGVPLRDGSLGRRGHGYQFFKSVKQGIAKAPFAAHFTRGHRVFIPAPDVTDVFTAVGPWKKGRGRPVLVLRKGGRSALFAAVHDPSGKTVKAVEFDGGHGRMSFAIHLSKGTERLCLRPRARKRGGRKARPYSRLYEVYFNGRPVSR